MDIEVISTCLNFAVVVGILTHFGRKPIIDFFKTRSEVLSQSVREADALAQAAETARTESERKLKEAGTEMAARQRELTEQLALLKTTALEKAQKEAERIKKDSEALAEGERQRARQILIKETAEETVALVKKYVSTSMEEADRNALVGSALNLISTNGHT